MRLPFWRTFRRLFNSETYRRLPMTDTIEISVRHLQDGEERSSTVHTIQDVSSEEMDRFFNKTLPAMQKHLSEHHEAVLSTDD